MRVALSMKKSEKERGKRSSISIMPKCPIPKLLTYNNLLRENRKIDIGNVYQLRIIFKKPQKMILFVVVFENWKSFCHALHSFT